MILSYTWNVNKQKIITWSAIILYKHNKSLYLSMDQTKRDKKNSVVQNVGNPVHTELTTQIVNT